MPYFSFLNDDASLEDIVEHRFDRFSHFALLSQSIMRDESSELDVGARELIAALVSGANQCRYCYGAHVKVAEAFNLPEKTIAQLVENVDDADIDDKFKPLLKLVSKLTTSPHKVIAGDVSAASDAGWSEAAIEDAIAICGLFSFANRMALGYGLSDVWSDKRQRSIDNLITGDYAAK